jgi:hypothetical protein
MATTKFASSRTGQMTDEFEIHQGKSILYFKQLKMSEEEVLDTTWIDDFEKVDKEYESFYSEDLLFVNVTIVYVNASSEIDHVKTDKVFLRNKNIMSKEELIGIVKRNHVRGQKKFTIMTMLRYNFDVEPLRVPSMLREKPKGGPYLAIIKEVDDIVWSPTITMFQDLNNLYIVFYEDVSKVHEGLRRTKRVFLGAAAAHKKTMRRV